MSDQAAPPTDAAPEAPPAPPPLPDPAPYLQRMLGDTILEIEQPGGALTLRVKRDEIVRVAKLLRDDPQCGYEQLVDLCGVDYPEQAERFEVVYQFLSLKYNRRLRVKVTADEDTPVPSLTGVYNVAGWFEREVWDLYGVFFDDHPDLRRILTDYGFEGHPMRKDFPLTGYVEVRYDDEQKRVVYEPVKLTQDFRRFDFLSPWEGMTDMMLPGDEKATIPPFREPPAVTPTAAEPQASKVTLPDMPNMTAATGKAG